MPRLTARINFDGLSVRELRSVRKSLNSASYTSGKRVQLNRIPNVFLFVVSRGYPESLARAFTSEVGLEMFHAGNLPVSLSSLIDSTRTMTA